MEKGIIRMKDIARELNLSVSTVSKALKGSYEISSETQKRVLDYAQKVNFVPNPIAQGLRKGRSKIIAVIVPNIDNNFFSQVINGIESIAFEKGYNVIITQTHESFEREVLNVHNHLSRSVDGLLVSVSSETNDFEHFEFVQNKGLPIVFFDRVPDQIQTHKIISNNFKGTYQATTHLISEGFRRIAQITSSNFLSITKERLDGYTQALRDHQFEVDENLIRYCEHGGMIEDETQQAVSELLNLSQPPDAILTASDRLSITTFKLLEKLNIRIPQDIALVAFTNSNATEIFNPSLTAIVQPAYKMGQVATEALIKLLERRRKPVQFEKTVLDTELIIKNSSRRI